MIFLRLLCFVDINLNLHTVRIKRTTAHKKIIWKASEFVNEAVTPSVKVAIANKAAIISNVARLFNRFLKSAHISILAAIDTNKNAEQVTIASFAFASLKSCKEGIKKSERAISATKEIIASIKYERFFLASDKSNCFPLLASVYSSCGVNASKSDSSN